MGNRSLTEIVGNILDASNGRATRTKIMYTAFLSYNELKEYLSVLIENNLVEYLDGTKTFETTEKGLNYLKMHMKWQNYYRLLLPKTTNYFYNQKQRISKKLQQFYGLLLLLITFLNNISWLRLKWLLNYHVYVSRINQSVAVGGG
jgi:predicted transcriptional regulator